MAPKPGFIFHRSSFGLCTYSFFNNFCLTFLWCKLGVVWVSLNQGFAPIKWLAANIVSAITYNVLSRTLNATMPCPLFHAILFHLVLILHTRFSSEPVSSFVLFSSYSCWAEPLATWTELFTFTAVFACFLNGLYANCSQLSLVLFVDFKFYSFVALAFSQTYCSETPSCGYWALGL